MSMDWNVLQGLSQRLIRQAFERTIPSMKSTELSNSLYGLGLSGSNWTEFTIALRSKIEQKLDVVIVDMKAQELTTLFYG